MRFKQITIEVDLPSLNFKELQAVTKALAALEELGKQGIINFNVKKINTPRKRRSDANTELPPLQPQTQTVLNYLTNWPGKEFTAKEIAKATQINSQGINGQLHTLSKRGLVEYRKIKKPNSMMMNLWKASASP